MSDTITFERQTLYEEVWTDPVSTVSRRYDLSDNGLRKICIKLGVPLPPVGYWARLRAGQHVKRLPLPRHDGPTTFEAYPLAYTRRSALSDDAAASKVDIEAEEARPENRVIPNDSGDWKHPLIKAFAKYARQVEKRIAEEEKPRRSDKWEPRLWALYDERKPGGLFDLGGAHAAIIVTPALRHRALSIADAFFIALEGRGFKVKLQDSTTLISYRDIAMMFRLSEMVQKVGSGHSRDAWEALGRLRIVLRQARYEPHLIKEIKARDEADVTIESQLNGVLARLRRMIPGFENRELARKNEARKRQERERQFEISRWHDQAAIEAATREKHAVEAMFAEAEQSEAIERKRQYLARLEFVARERGLDTAPDSRLGQWLQWARAACDARDPLIERLNAFGD
ncbi:hypothetical protein [Burkholderia gladioli]|uniref:hypothetical protein n=1 Tax=Burkholderia gladioli TaxID=28095 RepID=UPI0016410AE6|nr:hypothetical protein [Burkholderia gladioli]